MHVGAVSSTLRRLGVLKAPSIAARSPGVISGAPAPAAWMVHPAGSAAKESGRQIGGTSGPDPAVGRTPML